MELRERVKALREKAGWTHEELAGMLHVKRSTYTRYENGSLKISTRTLSQIASIFGVTTDYLLGNERLPGEAAPGFRRVPVLGNIVAGLPSEAIANPDPDDWEEVPEDFAHGKELFALRIHGESMEPVLMDGDVVIAERLDDCESGQIAIVLIEGYDATCKQVKKQLDGITLIGYNAAVYPPHFYTNEEVENLPVQILGVVREMRRTFR